jgi:hypothetical protein
MSKIIAVVRLAPGQVAFYDELTSTHLTMGNPMTDIYDYMKTDRIKRAVSNKILSLVTGSFNVDAAPVAPMVEVKVTAPVVKAEEVKRAVEEIVAEPIVEPIVEEVKVEAVEEIVEEAKEVEINEVEETELDIKPKSKRKKREE